MEKTLEGETTIGSSTTDGTTQSKSTNGAKKSGKSKGGQQGGGETYKRICKLGKGAFGTAYLVECQSDKSKVVIK